MRDDIIKMAREAGYGEAMAELHAPALERFYNLAVQHEREKCAKLEKELILSPAFFATMDEFNAHRDAVLAYRNLIRARGEKQ